MRAVITTALRRYSSSIATIMTTAAVAIVTEFVMAWQETYVRQQMVDLIRLSIVYS